jgi:quercetin dioxygenase-like cupin family protein
MHRLFALLLSFALASCASISPTPAHKNMVAVAFSDAKFVPVVARLPDGPRMAVLWGDPTTGPSAVLLEMKRGSVPLHVHSADYHLVVLEGTMKHWIEGDTEETARPLGPGSYWFQPGGQPHADACLTEKCVMQIVWSGKRDAQLAKPLTK